MPCPANLADVAPKIRGVCQNNKQADIGGLEQIMMDCEEGRLFITKVASVLLCLTADASVGFGMLKAKAAALIHHLEVPLQKVDMH